MDATTWRYQEGYLTVDGESVLLTDRLCSRDEFPGHDEVIRRWGGGSRCVEGVEQVDEVGARPEFAELGIARIWRRAILPIPSRPPSVQPPVRPP